MALLAFVLASPVLQYFLNARPLRFFGTVSFGIYLLYWPIMFFSLPILANLTFKKPIFSDFRWFIFALIYLIITFIISTIFYISC